MMPGAVRTKILIAILAVLAAIAGDLAWQRRQSEAAEKRRVQTEQEQADFWKKVDKYQKTEKYQWSGK